MRNALPTLALVACTGSGSDIGPSIPQIPSTSYRVLVRDDQERGVCSAVVSVAGFAPTGPTGNTGRADWAIEPSGFRTMSVDATWASATDTDILGSLTVAGQMPGDFSFPWVVYLPDQSASAGLVLSAGVQASAQVLDDSATSGAILTIPAGSNVDFAGATGGTVRTGPLSVEHLPAAFDPSASGGLLTGSGVFVGPGSLTVSPGAALSMPNDASFPANSTVPLLVLDPATGLWQVAGTGTVDPAGTRIDTAPGAVQASGLYTFGATTTVLTTVTGRVLSSTGEALSGVKVRGPQAFTTTASDGTFALADLAALDGSGQPRTVRVLFHGGRWQRPVTTFQSVPLTVGSQSLGDVPLATGFVTAFRSQLIARGAVDPEVPFAMSSVSDLAEASTIGEDGSALFTIEDMDSDQVGFLITEPDPEDIYGVLSSEASLFLPAQQRNFDLQLFMDPQQWYFGTGSGTETIFLDARGTSQMVGASLVFDIGSGDQYFSTTIEGATAFRVDLGVNGQATASSNTSSDGNTAVSAYSVCNPQTGRLEMPLLRANRAPLGQFQRFGLFAGDLPSTGNTRVLRVTPRITLGQWYDDVFFGRSDAARVPFKVDPAVTGGTQFLVGIPLPQGNLAAAMGDQSGSSFTLLELAWQTDAMPVQGTRGTASLTGPVSADTDFLVQRALENIDPAMTPADFAFDLSTELSAGILVDMVHGVTGNQTVQANGQDVSFLLPALSGSLAGATYYLSYVGSTTTGGGTTVRQQTLVPITATTGASMPLHPVPNIISPLPGASVPATGFQVQFTVPAATLYTTLSMTNQSGNTVRNWLAVVPANVTTFTFRQLPTPAPTPLTPGSWKLQVSVARVQTGVVLQQSQPYQSVISRWVGIDAFERGVCAISSSTIDLTLQ